MNYEREREARNTRTELSTSPLAAVMRLRHSPMTPRASRVVCGPREVVIYNWNVLVSSPCSSVNVGRTFRSRLAISKPPGPKRRARSGFRSPRHRSMRRPSDRRRARVEVGFARHRPDPAAMPPAASPPAGLESLQASIEGLRAVVVALAASKGASAGGGAKSNSGGGTGDATDRVEALHTEASLLFLDLRAANRATLESVDASREAAREAKRELDDQRLLLQNVQYEKGHVRKEIRTSSEFVSEFPDEKVGLCDVETFFAEMATNVRTGSSDDDIASSVTKTTVETTEESLRALDAHALTLKRLAHELRRREALVRRRDALEQKKTALTRKTAADRAFLDGLRGELGALRTAVEPLRVKLSSDAGESSSDGFFADIVGADKRSAEILRDASLPPPLYVLFAALVGVAERRRGESIGKMKMVVSFETGGEDEAAEAGEAPREKRAPEKNDEDDEDRDGGRKRKRAPSPQRAHEKETETTTSTRVVPAPGAHEAHETRVVLRLAGADENGAAVVFRYFPSLRVVTAEVRVLAGEPSSHSRGVHVRGSTLLVDLFPGDDGTRAPSASVAGSVADHSPRVSRKNENAFLSHEWDIGGSRRDRPFLWCQHLAGLDPLPLVPPLSPEARARLGSEAAEKSLFSDAAATERAVAAHAEQRRGATVVAALEARFIDAASLERGARRVAAAAEAKLGVSGLEADALGDAGDASAAAEPEPAAGGVSGNARAFLTSFRETFGEDAERESDEGDGGCFRWSGSPVAARLAATGDAATVAARGARRFAARVEVSNRPFGSASSSQSARESGGGARAQSSSAFRDERITRYLRFAIEVPASFPTRPASVALAVRVTSADFSHRPPPSPADAEPSEPSFDDELGAFANDARLAEAAANSSFVESEASTEASALTRPSADAALVRCVARILRAAETYFPPLGAGGAAEEHGTRRGRERRKAR